jgi:ribosomal RNA-processing protein 17
MLKESSVANGDIEPQNGSPQEETEEWGGFSDRPELDIVDHEEEYIDEDRYTTVTVESVGVNRHGFWKPDSDMDGDTGEGDVEAAEPDNVPAVDNKARPGKASKRPPKKRKQFRYETKLERSIENVKQKARHNAKRK